MKEVHQNAIRELSRSRFPSKQARLMGTLEAYAHHARVAIGKVILLRSGLPQRGFLLAVSLSRRVPCLWSLQPLSAHPPRVHKAKKDPPKKTAKKTDTAYSIPDPEGPAGRREVVFFESHDPYTGVLHQVDLNYCTLRVPMAGVRVTVAREEGGLAVARSLIDGRVAGMLSLLDRLELRMKKSPC